MNPTKPTPSLRELLYVFGNRPASSASDSHLYKLFSAIVDRLEKDTPCTNAPDASKTAAHEPPMNTKTATAPNADPPPLGVNHQKCDRCGNPLWLHGPYYMLCLCDAAASPAESNPPSSPPISSSSTPNSSSAASSVEPSGPAGEGRVPEWVEKCCHGMEMPSSWTAVYEGLAALRADRDRWREKAESAEAFIVETTGTMKSLERDCELSDSRIAELEAAQARQMVTIETLTAQLNEASKACEMWMTLAQPARKYPSVEQVNQWHGQWYRGFSAKVFSDWLRDRAREQGGKAP
jgi:hypothetical protein